MSVFLRMSLLARVVCGAFVVSLAVGFFDSAHAQSDAVPAINDARTDAITPVIQSAIDRGLAYLAQTQQPDGSWSGSSKVASTSLACLAFLANGEVPGRSAYTPVIDRGIDYILSQANDTGLISDGSSPMYTHGFAMVSLGELYGMVEGHPDSERAKRMHEVLKRGVVLLENAQNNEGGWRYSPSPSEADLSVVICQVMGLRAARNAGIEVPPVVINNAIEYLKKSQVPNGRFSYMLGSGPGSDGLVGAGCASLFYAGQYDGGTLDKGLKQLKAVVTNGGSLFTGSHSFYAAYYVTQASFLAGDDYGGHWSVWWPKVSGRAMEIQGANGGWTGGDGGDAYSTSMALIILQIPKRYLPIFQH